MYEDIKKHLEGEIAKHRFNCKIYMRNAVGVGEHHDIMDSVKAELSKLAEAEDMLNALEKHLK